MSTSPRRLPISRANIALVTGSLAGAIASAAFGNLLGTFVLAALGVGGLISALVARRAGASDLLRINAIEYRDERDSQLARRAFAIVGVVALVLALLEVFVAALLSNYFLERPLIGLIVDSVVCLQLAVLCIAWTIANSYVVRRG